MGRWCEVKCKCPDRRLRDARLRDGDYVCGHRDGIEFEISPHGLFYVANAIEDAFRDANSRFEIFLKLPDWRSYDDDERLVLSQADRELWRLEIEELQGYLSGKFCMDQQTQYRWDLHWKEHFAMPSYYSRLQQPIEEVLQDGLKLCDASERTGNPIEFSW